MQKDLKTRLKLRPPDKFKKRGLRFLPKAKTALKELKIDEESFLKKFDPQMGSYDISNAETLFRFYGRYNRSGMYVIHCREIPIEKELSS